MTPRTVFLSRLLGLYLLLIGLSMMLHRQSVLEIVTSLLHNAPVMWVVGAFTVLGGLAIILAHDVWSGGAVPVLVTLIGWGSLIKGASFLFLPVDAQAGFFLGTLHYAQFFYVYCAVDLALGAFLTYSGFQSVMK